MKPYSRRVQYYETDMMGIVHHANYIRWMEEARVDFMERIGFPYAVLEAKGVFSPVRSLRCDYKRPCTFGDKIDITVSLESFNGVVATLRYRMTKADGGEEVCEAVSEHCFLDREGRFVRLKRDMPGLFARMEELCAEEGKEKDGVP